MKPAVTYSRVSTLTQKTDGVSMDAQDSRARAWCEAHGYSIAGAFSDPAMSGKRADNRPGLQAALNLACKSKGVLVVYSLSRLARSVPDIFVIARRLEKAGADLVSLTEAIDTTTAMGKFVFVLLAGLAALERDITSERTTTSLSYKRERGMKYGEVPYGYRVELDPACPKHTTDPSRSCSCTLIEVPSEQAVIREVRLAREGSLPTAWPEIAASLNGRGIGTKKGKSWTSANLRKVVLGTRRTNGIQA